MPNIDAYKNIMKSAEDSQNAMLILLFISIVLALVFRGAMK